MLLLSLCSKRIGMLDGIVWKCPFGLPGGENFFCGYGAKDGEEECNGQEAMSI